MTPPNITDATPGDVPNLLPCPFCGVRLVHSDALSTRRRKTFVHPETKGEPCLLESRVISDDESTAVWNRRADRAAREPAPGVEAIDRIAQWLHDEVEWPDPDFPNRSWPDHDEDTGMREGGGYVTLVPMDVVEQFREIARRLIRGKLASLLTPSSDTTDAIRREAREPDDLTEAEIQSRAKRIIRQAGWEPGNRVNMHSAVQLMVRLGMDLTRRPAQDRCGYPDCDCCDDATCAVVADRAVQRAGKSGGDE